MPIITPALPSMCATHNITESTKKVILRELRRGGDITDNIMSGKMQWKQLFVKNTFFPKDYKYYLSVIASSTSEEAQLIWSGSVESKVRFLCGYLDQHASIALACPFNKGFERQHKCHTDEEIEKAKSCLEFQVKDTPSETTDAKQHQTNGGENGKAELDDGDQEANGSQKVTTVFTSTWYIGLELNEGKFPSWGSNVSLCCNPQEQLCSRHI